MKINLHSFRSSFYKVKPIRCKNANLADFSRKNTDRFYLVGHISFISPLLRLNKAHVGLAIYSYSLCEWVVYWVILLLSTTNLFIFIYNDSNPVLPPVFLIHEFVHP